MEARILLRTQSGPLPSPIISTDHDVLPRSIPCRMAISPRSIHLEIKDRRRSTSALHRSRSEASLTGAGLSAAAASPSKTAEEVLRELSVASSPILSLGISDGVAAVMSRGAGLILEEEEFSGSGSGNGRKVGGGGRGGGGGDPKSDMGAYYREMLRADPENPLILMNYGKFLQEVEGDLVGAEECYSRSILVNPSDGEALSLYGNLMWEAHRDEEKAEDYLQRAVEASPEDCYVMAAYAHFLWDAEERSEKSSSPASAAAASSSFAVEAF